jgi:uncharacterized repeat protein (TIGR01451 family)
VDAGVTSDIDGEPRPWGLAPDLGADEMVPLLAVRKQASANPVVSGERLTYTITVTNTGHATLQAIVTDVLPVHVAPSELMTWTTGAIAPGEVWTQTVLVTVEQGYRGALTNVVRVGTAEGATGAYTETVRAVVATLTVTKRANAPAVRTGECLTYTISVTNTGDLALHATVTDVLPAQVTPAGVISPPGMMTWTTGAIAPGAVWTQTLAVTVEMGYVGALTNVVRVGTVEGAAGVCTETVTVGPYRIYLPLVVRP